MEMRFYRSGRPWRDRRAESSAHRRWNRRRSCRRTSAARPGAVHVSLASTLPGPSLSTSNAIAASDQRSNGARPRRSRRRLPRAIRPGGPHRLDGVGGGAPSRPGPLAGAGGPRTCDTTVEPGQTLLPASRRNWPDGNTVGVGGRSPRLRCAVRQHSAGPVPTCSHPDGPAKLCSRFESDQV